MAGADIALPVSTTGADEARAKLALYRIENCTYDDIHVYMHEVGYACNKTYSRKMGVW
jgi:hypothetical protein